MNRIPDLEEINPWEDGLRTGAASIIDAIVSMLELGIHGTAK